MSDRRRCLLVFEVFLILAVTLACRHVIGPRTAPVVVPTATRASLVSSAATPTAMPDLSGVTLSLQDLPDGFEEVALAELGMLEDDLRETLEVESAFAFKIMNSEHFQTIKGFVTAFPARIRESDDEEILLDQTNVLADSIIGAFGVEVDELSLPEPVGDVATGRTFAVKLERSGLEDYAVRTDLLVFQRDFVTVVLLLEYIDDIPPAITVFEVAGTLDRQIIETFGSGN